MRKLVAGVLGVLFLIWLVGIIAGAQANPPLAVAPTRVAVPATVQVPTAPPTRPASVATSVPTATPPAVVSRPIATLRAIPKFPIEVPGSGSVPAYTLTAAIDRNNALQPGRQRYRVELDIPEAYDRDQVTAVLRHAVGWSLDVLPNAKTVVVWASTVPRREAWGWTGEGFASKDGRDWAGLEPDDGKIHVTYTPYLGASAKFDIAR